MSKQNIPNHVFNILIAKHVGVHSAVIFQNFSFWIDKNKIARKNYHDGRYWMYSSHAAFEEIFPYLTASQIRTAIKNLLASGLILKSNYNKMGYDRTLWYAIGDKIDAVLDNDLSNSIRQKSQKHLHNTSIPSANIIKPIPNITKNIETDIVANAEPIPSGGDMQTVAEYLNVKEPSLPDDYKLDSRTVSTTTDGIDIESEETWYSVYTFFEFWYLLKNQKHGRKQPDQWKKVLTNWLTQDIKNTRHII